MRRTSEAYWRVGVREGGWPAAFALAFRDLSLEAWRRGSLTSLPGCLSGTGAGADVVTETQWLCKFCLRPGAVAQNEAFLLASHLPKDMLESLGKSGNAECG